ncbi:hypothetical protein KK083_10115 [Fulvivirgaceae bacterium PWU4]|uniref:YbbR-like domain-containing protein n=1 Tax=Chryseosolibacter histidini TaxID=2782349 RepID=A0AAP2DJ02_9BACT|nr:hypothetical protein [Chryseosolibacter histidini]MBT1697231.1 hypothetical protein [Chryseosolibacter histidini]
MSPFNSILNILRFNRRNWKAVVLCVFAATVFWFFNALNKTYTTNINFPLRFDYDHEEFVPVRALPAQVRINVTGNGWELFKRSTGVKIAPLEIPLERPSEVKKIVGSNLPMFFSNQVEGLEINFVLTDTIYIDLEPKAGRWVKLAMDSLQFNLKDGYGVASEISITPDSVYLEGPERIVSRFDNPVLLKLRHRNIDENFSDEVELDIPSSDVIKRDPPTVSVKFNVERMVQLKDSLLITAENVPSTVSIVEKRLIPVTVSVPESMADKFTLDSARAVIDLRGFRRGEAKLLPRVDGLPPFSHVVKIDSVRIRL